MQCIFLKGKTSVFRENYSALKWSSESLNAYCAFMFHLEFDIALDAKVECDQVFTSGILII